MDFDLSAMIFDEDWQYQEHVSWTNLRSPQFQVFPSGDIISAPDGASEFIDIHLPSVERMVDGILLSPSYLIISNHFSLFPSFCRLDDETTT